MKTQTKPKSKFRGFYTALALSLVMIGAACVFAYRQTSQTLEQNLNSLSEQMEVTTTATLPYEAPVVGVQTDVAMETETTVTATSATEETAAPETTPETTAPETEPEETPMHQLTPPLSDFSILNPFSAAGSDVFAIDTGTVSEVCSDALWGYTVTIDHDNGITSRYCGLDGTLEVREGDTVQTGQKLGVTGANPDLESAAEPHLHLEVKKGGAYVDPTAYFG